VGGGKTARGTEKIQPRRKKNRNRRRPSPQAPSRKPEANNQKPEARRRKPVAGSRRPEAGGGPSTSPLRGSAQEREAGGRKKAWIYIDGFNLYYGAVKGTPYRWLDVRKMCELLLPDLQVEKIKYFTARVSGRTSDPGQPTRQQIYLRALRTLPGLEIILGSFLSHDVMMVLADPAPGQSKFALVVKTEEKGSDVNMASHMIHDAHKKSYDVAVLVSNDSDLLAPVRIVRHEMGIPVGILNPHRYTPSKTLMPYATFVKKIREGVLEASQLPPRLKDEKGEIRKPERW
jgi:uncharacterized LabA/DUF88 family protein